MPSLLLNDTHRFVLVGHFVSHTCLADMVYNNITVIAECTLCFFGAVCNNDCGAKNVLAVSVADVVKVEVVCKGIKNLGCFAISDGHGCISFKLFCGVFFTVSILYYICNGLSSFFSKKLQ